jgi:rare lipoprotein A
MSVVNRHSLLNGPLQRAHGAARQIFAVLLVIVAAFAANNSVLAAPSDGALMAARSIRDTGIQIGRAATPLAERFEFQHESLTAVRPGATRYVPAAEAIAGTASTYDPTNDTDRDSGDMITASGDIYDPGSWTAAIRTDLRAQFGGVRFGRNYRPSFVLVESGDKQLIVRVNDVGPLRPGRIIDLNRRAMRFFDPTFRAGLLENVKVTLLAGTAAAAGPVNGSIALTGDFEQATP